MNALSKLLVVASILITGCASEPSPPPPLTFSVTADAQTNGGGLFYFVIRRANDKQFMSETYQDVANKAFLDPPDPNSLGVFSIVPGSKQDCAIAQPAQGHLALYFLFTQPGNQWKKLVSPPLANKYSIRLNSNSQVNIDLPKPWYDVFAWF